MTYNINFLRRKNIEISDALHTLCPGSSWEVGDTYDSIKNFKSDEYELPSEEEINAEIKRLQDIADGYQYQRLRKQEYPSIEDQLDILYHQGYEGWKSEIDKIKEKHPKPLDT
jgi:hypothetical protein